MTYIVSAGRRRPRFTAMMLFPAALVPLTYLFVSLETATGVQRFVEAYRLLKD